MFMDRLDLVFFGLNAMSILLIITTFDILFKGLHLYQGPKLTLLGKRQLATEIFLFSRQVEKCGGQKVLIQFFLCSKTQIDGKTLVANFSFKNQTEENRFRLQLRFFR